MPHEALQAPGAKYLTKALGFESVLQSAGMERCPRRTGRGKRLFTASGGKTPGTFLGQIRNIKADLVGAQPPRRARSPIHITLQPQCAYADTTSYASPTRISIDKLRLHSASPPPRRPRARDYSPARYRTDYTSTRRARSSGRARHYSLPRYRSRSLSRSRHQEDHFARHHSHGHRPHGRNTVYSNSSISTRSRSYDSVSSHTARRRSRQSRRRSPTPPRSRGPPPSSHRPRHRAHSSSIPTSYMHRPPPPQPQPGYASHPGYGYGPPPPAPRDPRMATGCYYGPPPPQPQYQAPYTYGHGVVPIGAPPRAQYLPVARGGGYGRGY